MAEERKAEDFPLEKPSLGDNPPEEGTGAYDSMMASYNSSMADYETRLDAWLKGEVNADAPDAADGQSPDTQPEVEEAEEEVVEEVEEEEAEEESDEEKED